MITIQEIRKKAEAFYLDYLQSVVKGDVFFPYLLRSNKQVSPDFALMQKELAEVAAASTHRKGYGYTVHYEAVATRKHGLQNLPESITFETEHDYLRFIGKVEEVACFKQNLALVLNTIPDLFDWCVHHVRYLIEYAGQWNNLLNVCLYFREHPCPQLYIRELPIEVHTKFVEQHVGVLQSLLDFLLPEVYINRDGKNFCSRFHLKQAEPQVRFRLLDTELADIYFSGITDLSIPIGQFCLLQFQKVTVFMVENLMTFLTFPPVKRSIVIWGKGFQAEILKECLWMKELPLFYWGDMDVHGFQILSQVRGYFPQTTSVLMNRETYVAFEEMSVPNRVPHPPLLPNLNAKEAALYTYLCDNGKRLEQEKVSYRYSLSEILK